MSTQPLTRPRPNATDIANATAWIDGPYRATVDASYHAFHRDSLIRHAANAEMQKRIAAQHRVSDTLEMEEAA